MPVTRSTTANATTSAQKRAKRNEPVDSVPNQSETSSISSSACDHVLKTQQIVVDGVLVTNERCDTCNKIISTNAVYIKKPILTENRAEEVPNKQPRDTEGDDQVSLVSVNETISPPATLKRKRDTDSVLVMDKDQKSILEWRSMLTPTILWWSSGLLTSKKVVLRYRTMRYS
jgi:hypothetical protein